MRITWVEKLEKTGAISPNVKKQIYGDILKLAYRPKPPAVETAINVASPIIGMAALGGGAAMFHKFRKRVKLEQIEKNRALLSERFAKKDLNKAQARFDEIAQMAPTIASNPEVMDKIINDRLNSGLTANDVMQIIPMEIAMQDAGYKPQKLPQEKTARLVGEICADTIALAAMNVGGDLIREDVNTSFDKTAVKKTKSFSAALKKMLALSSVPLLAGAGLGGVRTVMDKINTRKLNTQIQDSYGKAMDMDRKDPDGGYLHANEGKALQAFKTLTHFAPQVAAEPLAAKTFMKKIVQMDDIQSTDVKDLTDIQKNISQAAGKSPFMEGFSAGVDVTGLKGMLTDRPSDKNLMSVMEEAGAHLS